MDAEVKYWGICLFHVVWTNFFCNYSYVVHTEYKYILFFINWTLRMSDNLVSHTYHLHYCAGKQNYLLSNILRFVLNNFSTIAWQEQVYFDVIMIISPLYTLILDCYNVILLKKHSANRNIFPLWHIIPILNQPSVCSYTLMQHT